MEEFKTLEELKEEFGKTYDIKLYEMGISAMKEIARLNKIIETLDLYFKYMVDDRDFDKVSQLSDRAFNEYITLSIVEDYYKLVKEEPDEQLKEIKEQIKKEKKNKQINDMKKYYKDKIQELKEEGK